METKLLPTIIMLIQVGAAVVYACNCDFRRVAYWLAATVLVASVTY